jgi:hypothetical protein
MKMVKSAAFVACAALFCHASDASAQSVTEWYSGLECVPSLGTETSQHYQGLLFGINGGGAQCPVMPPPGWPHGSLEQIIFVAGYYRQPVRELITVRLCVQNGRLEMRCGAQRQIGAPPIGQSSRAVQVPPLSRETMENARAMYLSVTFPPDQASMIFDYNTLWARR